MSLPPHKLLNPNDISLFEDVDNNEDSLAFLDEISSDLQPREILNIQNRPPIHEAAKPSVSVPSRPPIQQRQRTSPHKKIIYVMQRPTGNTTMDNTRKVANDRNTTKSYANIGTSRSSGVGLLNQVNSKIINQSEDDLAASYLQWDEDFVQPVRTTQVAAIPQRNDRTNSRPPIMLKTRTTGVENTTHRNVRIYSKTTWTYKEMCMLAMLNSEEPHLLCDQIYIFLELHFFKRLNKVPNGEIRQKSSYKNSVRHCLNDALFYKVEGPNTKQTRYGLHLDTIGRCLGDCRNNFEQRRTEFLADLTYPDLLESIFRGQLKNFTPPHANVPRVLYPVRRINNEPQIINNYKAPGQIIQMNKPVSTIVNRNIAVKRTAQFDENQRFAGPQRKIIYVKREPSRELTTKMYSNSIQMELERIVRQPTLNTLYWSAASKNHLRPPTFESPNEETHSVQTTHIGYHLEENQTTQGDSLGGSPTSSNSIYSEGDIGDLSEFFQM